MTLIRKILLGIIVRPYRPQQVWQIRNVGRHATCLIGCETVGYLSIAQVCMAIDIGN